MLADAAVTAAIRTGAPTGTTFVPIDLKVNYLRPLAGDGREARAHAKVVHGGRRIAVAGAEVFDPDGTPIAVATGSAVSVVTGSAVSVVTGSAVAVPPSSDVETRTTTE